MKKNEGKPSDMAGSHAAILRAADRAWELARLHGLKVPVWRDGRVVYLSPDERNAQPAKNS